MRGSIQFNKLLGGEYKQVDHSFKLPLTYIHVCNYCFNHNIIMFVVTYNKTIIWQLIFSIQQIELGTARHTFETLAISVLEPTSEVV